MPKRHPIPRFHCRDQGDQTWLLDRDVPVLCFDRRVCKLGHCVLAPGGPEMVPAPGSHWSAGGWFHPYWGNQISGKRQLIAFESGGTRTRAEWRIVTRLHDGICDSDWRMRVTYDGDLRSYVYHIVTTARVARNPGPELYRPHEFEYFDLYPTGLLDHKTAPRVFSGGVYQPVLGPLWDYVVYESQEKYAGSSYVIRAPLNRLVTSALRHIRVKSDGLVGFMNHPIGNPMVQLLGDTAAFSEMNTCNWFYDMHFRHDLNFAKSPPPKGTVVEAQFRLFCADFAFSQPLLTRSVLPGFSDEDRAAKAHPRYEESGVNSFERGLAFDEPDHSRFWRPFHREVTDIDLGLNDIRRGNTEKRQCVWDHTCARTGRSSLKVATSASDIAGWTLPIFDGPAVETGRRYRLSVYVRTSRLVGRGATLGYFSGAPGRTGHVDNQGLIRPTASSAPVKGTSDWHRLELLTEPMPETRATCLNGELRLCRIHPVLWHEGRGETWFDDFQLELAED